MRSKNLSVWFPHNNLLRRSAVAASLALAACSGGGGADEPASPQTSTSDPVAAAVTPPAAIDSEHIAPPADDDVTNIAPPAAPAAAAQAPVQQISAALSANPAFDKKVTVHLKKTFPGVSVVSFGVPVAPGRVAQPEGIRVVVAGVPVPAQVKALVQHHDKEGNPTSVASLLVQIPAAALPANEGDVDIEWTGGAGNGTATVPFAQASAASSETVQTAPSRTVVAQAGTNKIVDGALSSKTLFAAREPATLATFPEGYLADTGVLGMQVSSAQAHAPDNAGLAFLSDAAKNFGLSAMYADGYAANPDGAVDPMTNYEGWLYDRCATFLSLYTHVGDERFLRHAYRSCSYYGSKIGVAPGATFGISSIKPSADIKYSHLRGLYAYYALTGDEAALESGKAIADMWLNEPTFVATYRQGHVRGTDKLWTERLLGTSFEGLVYGHMLTGDKKYFTAAGELLSTAHRHITGDASVLAGVNPGASFPPQSCFIHSALQHGEGNAPDPWCSSWMSELLVDGLLQYQKQTDDPRVDDIFVRLARFVRDVGSQYKTKNPLDDTFMKPKACFEGGARKLMPIYGAGLYANGTRKNFGEWDDDEHCTDATALTAAAIRGLVRQGKFDANPVGPFASEGASFVAMHHELAHCAKKTFETWTRTGRDPSTWVSAKLATGAANPKAFIDGNKIGYPSYVSTPQRKLSWWLNMSLLQYGMLADAGVKVPALTPGQIQPAGCK